jgi:hypothetical protein
VYSVLSVAKNIGLHFSVAEEFNSVNLCESVSKKTLDSLCSLCPLWQKNYTNKFSVFSVSSVAKK